MEKALLKKMEEMDDEERKKLRQVLAETKKSGTDEEKKLNWMYKDKADSEEFLLGRRIDKSVTEEPAKEENKDAPGALFAQVISRRAEMDMMVKMREDPLYAIKKREEDAKRRLLENPIKMKQLQKVIQSQAKSKVVKSKQKKSKHKKKSSSDDDELLKQYLSILDKKKLKQTSDAETGKKHETAATRSRDESIEVSHEKSRRHDDDKQRKRRASNSSSHDDEHDRHRKPEGYGLIRPGSSESRTRRPESDHSRSPRSDGRTDAKHSRRHSEDKRPSRRRTPSPALESKNSAWKPEKKKKLSASEMERKRQEMLDYAKQRDEQRASNVARYKAEDETERKRTQKQNLAADFVKPMMMKHAADSSVEDRIKRNIYNIQRTNAALDKNFAKH